MSAKQVLLIATITFFHIYSGQPQTMYGSTPLVNTYSIVARDTDTGEMGVAVQSHWFSVGTIVSWGEAGIGVIAAQSFVNVSFGLRGLELLRSGRIINKRFLYNIFNFYWRRYLASFCMHR